jgi:hypothetical protein
MMRVLILLVFLQSARLVSQIPVYVIVFNRVGYVRNIVASLRRFTTSIVLLDNNSTQPSLLDFYDSLRFDPVVKISFIKPTPDLLPHRIVYANAASMPPLYAVTDPDMGLPDGLPLDFLDVFAEMTEEFHIGKVGCALNISGPLLPLRGQDGLTPREWELRFWTKKFLSRRGFECYRTALDTTMAVYNKKVRAFVVGVCALLNVSRG